MLHILQDQVMSEQIELIVLLEELRSSMDYQLFYLGSGVEWLMQSIPSIDFEGALMELSCFLVSIQIRVGKLTTFNGRSYSYKDKYKGIAF